MANKEWWETFAALDCIYLWSWNQLTDYIQHSACTDFIIHSTCTDTGQAFRFTQLGVLSIMEGGADTGDDILIRPNSTDLDTYIKILGGGAIELYAANGEDVIFYENATQLFRFYQSDPNNSVIAGPTSGNLILYGDDTNSCAAIILEGDGSITNQIEETNDFIVSTCSDEELLVVSATALTYKGTSICLSPCGGGSGSCPTKSDLPFIMYDDCDAETGIGFQFTIAGILSTMEGGADSGDNLLFKANSSNDCSWLELFGNAGAQIAIKAANIFEVSTCSLETLFEVDSSPTDKHIDFHCLDAHNFVLELRTTNPSGPTCLGQIWFRTDLV